MDWQRLTTVAKVLGRSLVAASGSATLGCVQGFAGAAAPSPIPAISASPGSLTFASESAPAQTLTLTTTGTLRPELTGPCYTALVLGVPGLNNYTYAVKPYNGGADACWFEYTLNASISTAEPTLLQVPIVVAAQAVLGKGPVYYKAAVFPTSLTGYLEIALSSGNTAIATVPKSTSIDASNPRSLPWWCLCAVSCTR